MKKMRSILFLVLLSALLCGFLLRFPSQELTAIFSGYGSDIRGLIMSAMDTGSLENAINDGFFAKEKWIDLYGLSNRILGTDFIVDAAKDRSVCRTQNGAVAFVYEPKDAFSEEILDSIQNLKSMCDSIGAESWFVAIPQKVCAVDNPFTSSGVHDYTVDITNYRKTVFADNGFRVLDLHEKIHEQNLNHGDLYFRTDHHWKGTTGLWAAGQLAEALHLSTGPLSAEQYGVESHPGLLLGTEGQRVGSLYCPKDDFDIMIPDFDTNFTFTTSDDVHTSGTFSQALLFRNHIDAGEFVYSTFLDGDVAVAEIVNNQNPYGTHILLFKDSYTDSLAPYLATVCGKVTLVDTRKYEGSALDLVREKQPEIVCVTMTAKVGNGNFTFQ